MKLREDGIPQYVQGKALPFDNMRYRRGDCEIASLGEMSKQHRELAPALDHLLGRKIRPSHWCEAQVQKFSPSTKLSASISQKEVPPLNRFMG